MDIRELVNITSRAWSLKILALMHEGVPGRQAPLLAATTASRTSFLASLNHLIALQLIERNPGHGHPLRPEYRLTAAGRNSARMAFETINAAERDDHNLTMVRRAWTVPVLAITHAPKRFTDIKAALPRVNDRALSQSLDLLHKNDWLDRDVDISMRPPRPFYQAKNTGYEISLALNSTITV